MVDSNAYEVRDISITLIDEPENPMRTDIDPSAIADLAASVRTSGLINPITVCPTDSRFQVVAGHRRLLACRLAGLSVVPCVVRTLDSDTINGIMATENLERSDIDPVDEAIYVGRIIGEDESKIPDLARRINRSVQWVRDRLAILEYPDYMLVAIKQGQLKLGVAKFLGAIDNERIQNLMVRSAITNGMTALQAEYQYNLWASGALDNIDNPEPAPDDLSSHEQVRARAMCVKCGKIAIDPNLQSVFIHITCPVESVS